jgi:L-threonylcarbamoyladenylate synthase
MMPALVTTSFEEALEALKSGMVVAYATETTYGLGVDATQSDSIRKLQTLKGRSKQNPFPILLPSSEALDSYASPVPSAAKALISRYWPGPLTIVLRAKGLPKELLGRSGGVGFRVSAHPLASMLVSSLGRCITATSANPSGAHAARNAKDVIRYFSNEEICIFDGGPALGRRASTVVDLVTADVPRLIREGPISWNDIEYLIAESRPPRVAT